MTLKIVQIALVTLALALAGSRPANAFGARVRWLASPDPRVVGYLVYVRAGGSPYDTPRNAGMPPRSADGSMSYDVVGLASGDYVFAVSGYTAPPNQETALSAEGRLGSPPPPCTIDQCSAPRTCEIGPSPNGTTCGASGSGLGSCGNTCLSGICTPTTASTLHTTQLKFQALAHAVRLTLRGRLAERDIPSPAEFGLTLTIQAPLDTGLLDLAIPPTGIRAIGTGSVFALARAPAKLPPFSIERLILRRSTDGWLVRAKILAEEWTSAPAGADLPTSWGLRLGDRCARDGSIGCSGTLHRVICQ